MKADINATEQVLPTSYAVIPDKLTGAEFVLVRFRLELLEACHLDLAAFLGLRQVLLRAGREVLGPGAAPLFDPPLASDPYALKRFQKGAPGFVLRPDPLLAGEWQEGDWLDLDVLLLGTEIARLDDFCRIIQQVGRLGMTPGGGRFDLSGVTSFGSDGRWRRIGGESPAPELLPLGEWLDRGLPLPDPVLEVLTPARLVTGGRVLRQPRFGQLFPFLLRRVTSMLYYHCQLEPVDDPQPLLDAASRVDARWLAVAWHAGDESAGRPGGLTGRLWLGGDGLEEVLWVVAAATLFGIGKGAAYGAGRCLLAGME